MIGYAISKNKVRIRLPEERWFHITESHDYMSGLSEFVLDTVSEPSEILEGDKQELIAIKSFNNKHIVVFYREVTSKDGFVITAFITSQIERVRRNRKVKWKKK
jgi:prolyl oligopeptidase PreP (S9A serine peptidase family)